VQAPTKYEMILNLKVYTVPVPTPNISDGSKM
jgi:hypothetical protein